MAVTTYTYEEGTNGSNVPSGSNGVIALQGTPTYATSAAVHGSMGVSCTAASGATSLIYANPNTAAMTGSVYVVPTVVAGSGGRAGLIKTVTGSNGNLLNLTMATNGTFVLADSAGTALATSSTHFTQGQIFRADWQSTWDGTTLSITVKLFMGANSEGSTPTDTISGSTATVSPARVIIGTSLPAWSITFDTLRLYNDTSAWPTAYNPSTPPPSVDHMWGGGPSSDGFVVVSKTNYVTSARLAISTASNMSSPTYVSAQTPDAGGYVRHVASGLSSGTQYYYQLADTPSGGSESLIGAVGKARTLKPAGPPQNFTVAFGSCLRTDTLVSNALDNIRTWDPDFMIHLGDFYYNGVQSTDPTVHAGKYASQITNAAGLKSLIQAVPMFYATSDHETNPDNSDSNNDYTAAHIVGYKQVVPYAQLADTRVPTVGRYQTWVVGRIRFILLDVRNTDRSTGTDTDSSSKTMLGATQKAWLKARLLDSEPLKVILSDCSWSGTSVGAQWADKWQSYATERQEIADFITTNNVKVDLWHGDSHYVGVDQTHNAWGGFPVLCGSPFDNVGSTTNFTFFDNAYNNDGNTSYSQYMRVTFTDDGTTITRVASGWDALNSVERVAQTITWNTRTGKVKVWNGSAWVNHPAKTWNGSAWVTHRVKARSGGSWIEGK